MLDGFDEFLFNTFMFAFRLLFKLAWALVRPILPDVIRGVFTVLSYPVSWAAIFVAWLWVFTDHTLIPSLVATAALVAVGVTAVLRPGLR